MLLCHTKPGGFSPCTNIPNRVAPRLLSPNQPPARDRPSRPSFTSAEGQAFFRIPLPSGGFGILPVRDHACRAHAVSHLLAHLDAQASADPIANAFNCAEILRPGWRKLRFARSAAMRVCSDVPVNATPNGQTQVVRGTAVVGGGEPTWE